MGIIYFPAWPGGRGEQVLPSSFSPRCPLQVNTDKWPHLWNSPLPVSSPLLLPFLPILLPTPPLPPRLQARHDTFFKEAGSVLQEQEELLEVVGHFWHLQVQEARKPPYSSSCSAQPGQGAEAGAGQGAGAAGAGRQGREEQAQYCQGAEYLCHMTDGHDT